jgi:hypothetical protein
MTRAALLAPTLGAAALAALACGGLGSPESTAPDPGSDGPADPLPSAAPTPPVEEVRTEPLAPIDTTIPRTGAAFLPLVQGMQITWELREQRGASFRLFGLAKREAGSRTLGSWTLEVNRPVSSEAPVQYASRFTRRWEPEAVGEDFDGPMVEATELLLWEEDGQIWMENEKGRSLAIEVEPGPPVLPTERVPCTVGILGGLEGLCQAVGGPMANEPGPAILEVARKQDGLLSALRVLTGIATIGLVIPGSPNRAKDLVRVSVRQAPRGAPMPALWMRWIVEPEDERGRPTLNRLVKEVPPDPASLSAIISTDGRFDRTGATLHAAGFLTPELALPVIRAQLREMTLLRTKLHMLVRTAEVLEPLPAAERGAVLEPLDPESRAMAERVLDGSCPGLAEAVASPLGTRWTEAVREHVGAGVTAPACEEAVTRIGGLSPEMVGIFVEAHDEEQVRLRFRGWYDGLPDDDRRLELLEAQAELLRTWPEAERNALVEPLFRSRDEARAREILYLPPLEE